MQKVRYYVLLVLLVVPVLVRVLVLIYYLYYSLGFQKQRGRKCGKSRETLFSKVSEATFFPFISLEDGKKHRKAEKPHFSQVSEARLGTFSVYKPFSRRWQEVRKKAQKPHFLSFQKQR